MLSFPTTWLSFIQSRQPTGILASRHLVWSLSFKLPKKPIITLFMFDCHFIGKRIVVVAQRRFPGDVFCDLYKLLGHFVMWQNVHLESWSNKKYNTMTILLCKTIQYCQKREQSGLRKNLQFNFWAKWAYIHICQKSNNAYNRSCVYEII